MLKWKPQVQLDRWAAAITSTEHISGLVNNIQSSSSLVPSNGYNRLMD